MADIVDAATRSRMMSGIRSKNTKPEVAIRKAIHRQGLRFRIHSSDLPGKPDMVFPAARAAIFVNGCFWHGHDCKYFRLPSTRPEFWAMKIAANKARDLLVRKKLDEADWRHLTIWECAIRGQKNDAVVKIGARAARWLRSRSLNGEIRGK
jgi:DNA mismatch endonuclease (patch repair protein)